MKLFKARKKALPPFSAGSLSLMGRGIEARFGSCSIWTVSDGGADRFYGARVADCLTAAGHTQRRLSPVRGTDAEALPPLRAALDEAKAGDVLLALGGRRVRRLCAALMRELPQLHFVACSTTLAGALALPEADEPLPEQVWCDPDTFSTQDEAAYAAGIATAIQWGIVFDRSLFELLYTAFRPTDVLSRCFTIGADILKAEQNGSRVRERLLFGCVAGRAYASLAEGELTEGDALALGMLWETRLALKTGVMRKDLLHDLDGIISFRGLPRASDISDRAVAERILRDTPADTVTFYLPERLGTCVRCDTDKEKLQLLFTERN